MTALSLRDISHSWPGGATLRLPALDVAEAERVLLLGRSGSGKSTLLSLVCGTRAPDAGTVTVCRTELSSLRAAARDRLRAERIGVIFQEFNLLPFGVVRDNIHLPLRFAPERRARTAPGEAEDLCRALALPDGVLEVKAHTLSVGQQQRVAVARALIGAPPLVVADEPTSALDADAQAAFMDLMFGQLDRTGAALLMVSHDERLAPRFDRVLRIEEVLA
ncbi:MAG: ATP-binding cassette domain-containing protein [Pseudomonadota bacterium]